MRSLALALLLSGLAGPALAAQDADAPEGDRRGATRAQRAQNFEMRGQRFERDDSSADQGERAFEVRRERAPRGERRAAVPDQGPALDFGREQAETPGERAQRRVAGDTVRDWRARDRGVEETPGERAQRRAAGDTVRDWRRAERESDGSAASIEERNLRRAPGGGQSAGGLVQPERPLPRVFDPEQRQASRTPMFGTEPPPPPSATTAHAEPQHRWSPEWRRDRRYNWWDWRRRHRSRFHLGFYFDPFGWDYYRYGIGWRLWPSYYHRSYWLHDPWHYRLPPAYGPYRWIRYHNDALLVNIYTGRVVDVIHNFFW